MYVAFCCKPLPLTDQFTLETIGCKIIVLRLPPSFEHLTFPTVPQTKLHLNPLSGPLTNSPAIFPSESYVDKITEEGAFNINKIPEESV